MRPVVEIADDDAFQQEAEHQHEAAADDDREHEGRRVLQQDESGIGAHGEQRAVSEVEDAKRAQDDRQTATDERQQRAEGQAVEGLRDEDGPAWHGDP